MHQSGDQTCIDARIESMHHLLVYYCPRLFLKATKPFALLGFRCLHVNTMDRRLACYEGIYEKSVSSCILNNSRLCVEYKWLQLSRLVACKPI